MNEKKYPEATVVGIGLIIIMIIVTIIINNTKISEDSHHNEFIATSSIIMFILRIAVIIWIVSIAKELKRDQLSWGIFAFFLPFPALIVIGQKKEKVAKSIKNNTILNDKNETSQIKKNDIKTFTEQKNILIDLKSSGVISESEYKEKLNLILKNEDRIKEQEKNEIIKNKVNERIKPYINKLSELNKLKVLSDEEFELKKIELINKHTKIIQDETYPNKTKKDYAFEKISKYNLTGVEIMGVSKLETKLTKSDTILKSKKTKIINIYSETDVDNIISNNQTEDYYLIELQGIT